MKKLGIGKYFEDAQNRVDCGLLVLTYVYIGMRLSNPEKNIIPDT